MLMPITSILASLSGFIIIWLSLNVSKVRANNKQAIGDIASEEYKRKNGALINFITTLPIILILMAFAETAHFCWFALACLALAYLIGRFCHIYSLYCYEVKTGRYIFRMIGMITTFAIITILAGINLWLSYTTLTARIASGVVNIAFRVIHLYVSAIS